jgi:signal transduction histidine kinase
MQSKEKKITNSLVAVASLVEAVVILGWYGHHAGLSLQFTWRWFALPLIGSLFVAIGCLILMLKRVPTRSGPFYWFMLLLVSNIGLTTMLLLEVLSATPQAEAFFQSLLVITWLPVAVLLLLFTVSYLERKSIALNPFTWGMLLSTFMLLVFVVGASNITENHIPAQSRLAWWGYANPPVRSDELVYWWIGILGLVSLILLVRAYRRETGRIAKKQLRIFVTAVAQYMIIAVTFDIVLRKVLHGNLPPMTFIYVTLMAVIIEYGIVKYGLFVISPTSLSGQILQDLSEAVVGINANYEIEFANSGVDIIFGRSMSTLYGRHINVLLGEDIMSHIRDTIEGPERMYTFEDVTVRQPHKLVDVSLTTSRVFVNGNTSGGYIFVFQNITELKKKSIELAHEKLNVERKVIERTRELHEERAKLHASIESLTLGFAFVSRDGKVLVQNHTLNRLLGIDEPFPDIASLARKMHSKAIERYCSSVLKPNASAAQHELAYEGKVLRVFVTSVTAEGGTTPIGSAMLIEDITEMKVLDRSRDEFFSIASHELRTPLTAIRGNSSMLLTYYHALFKDKAALEITEDIYKSSLRLIGIVNDFLDVSRLEQKRMAYNLAPFSLDKVIEEVIYEMKGVIREKNLTIVFDGKTLGKVPEVWADENKVKQVIYNLVGNASKFTENGTITLQAKQDGGKLKTYITDSGVGIPLELRNLLFHKFQQASGSIVTRDTTRGTGLGLYISKLMIEDMGGAIILEHSEVGKGSTFSFTLPIATIKQKNTQHLAQTVIDIRTGLQKKE